MKKTNIARLLFSCAALALVMGSCTKKDDTAAEKTDETIQVKVQAAQAEEMDQIYEFTSTIEPKVKNYISSAGGQRIEKIYVEVGSRVAKGQTLVKMESTSLATAQSQLDNIKTELDRIKALYKSGGASKQQVDQMQVQYDVAKKNIDNLKTNITLKSPISGVVTAKNFDNGDLSGSQPILQVMQINPVKLKFSVNESFYNKVKMGMPVKATVEVFGDEEFAGRVSLISPTIDPNTRTFYAEAEFSNASSKLRPGMFGRVEVNFGKANTVVVSDEAVVKQNGTNDKYVYVLKSDNTVEYRKITVGRRYDDRYSVLDGIQPGEKVVISDHNRLKNGSKVKVVK